MKYINTIKTIAVLFFLTTNLLFSQDEVIPNTPSVSSITRYVDYPVDLSTGIPNISVPMTKLPSRSSKIALNLEVSYHSSSIVAYDSLATDFGKGWSLNNLGVISREKGIRTRGVSSAMVWKNAYDSVQSSSSYYINPEHHKQDFQFSYLNTSGNFTVSQNASGLLEAKIADYKGQLLEVEILYTTSDFIITGFIIYDDKGYKYTFDKADNYINIRKEIINLVGSNIGENNSSNEGTNGTVVILHREVENSNFKISKIQDQHGVELMNFEYLPYYKVEEYHEGNESNTTYKISKITANGIGYVTFNRTTYSQDEIIVNSIDYKNYLNQLIVKYDFVYNTGKKLIELKQYDNEATNFQSYKFKYKKDKPLIVYHSQLDFDLWGYPNVFRKFCNRDFYDGNSSLNAEGYRSPVSRYSNPQYVTAGVIESITSPTGACTVFDFESNTYSYHNGDKLEKSRYKDQNNDTITVFNPNYFKDFDMVNQHNFTKNTVINHSFTSGGFNQFFFTINTTDDYYFMFYSDGHETTVPQFDENGQNIGTETIVYYPTFSLYKDDVLIETFVNQSPNHNDPNTYNDYGYRSLENYCNGLKFNLLSGQYKIIISNNMYPATGDFQLSTIKLNTTLKNWEYGPGIRIKSIRNFENENDYTNGASPVKEIAYTYTFFNDSSRSSGSFFGQRTRFSNYDPDLAVFSTSVQNIGPLDSNAYDYKNNWYRKDDGPIRYSNVTVVEKGNGNAKGRTEYSFITPQEDPYYSFLNNVINDEKLNYFSKNKTVAIYHENGTLLESTTFDYEVSAGLHPVNYPRLEPTKIISKTYLSGNVIENTQNFTYNFVNWLLSEKETFTSTSNEINREKYFYYPENAFNNPHRKSDLERVEVYKNSELLTTNTTEYFSGWTPINSFLPKTIKSSKTNNALENKFVFNNYNAFGKPLEVQQESGIPITYIWGYNQTQPIAKIENATYTQVQPYEANLQTLSNGTDEASLITALNNLRTSLPNAMITTYTYKPLVGISSITDPKGDKITYHYDGFNRLQFVKDKNGSILSDNKYYYKN